MLKMLAGSRLVGKKPPDPFGCYFDIVSQKPSILWVLLIFIVAFVGSMQTFLNVATWVLLSEIFPLHMRAVGMGISVFCLWIANAVLSRFFLNIVEAFSLTGTFFGFAVVNLIAVAVMFKFLPETRGRSLEDVEEDVTTGAIFQVQKKS